MTSGACGPLLSLLALIASTSSPEPASGLSSLIGDLRILRLEAVDDGAVAAPVVRQRGGGELALAPWRAISAWSCERDARRRPYGNHDTDDKAIQSGFIPLLPVLVPRRGNPTRAQNAPLTNPLARLHNGSVTLF